MLLSSLFVLTMILSACNHGSNNPSVDPPEESSDTDSEEIVAACNAVEIYNFEARNVCYTTACENLESNFLITFTEKTDVDSCDASRAVGICDTTDFNDFYTYYYDGDLEQLEIDCINNIGEWSTD